MKSKTYLDLGLYSDMVSVAARGKRLWPLARPGRRTQQLLRKTLEFLPGKARPQTVRVEDKWTRDGVDGELVTWSVGYGPRTEAWVLRPAGEKGRLPGVLAMHDHGGFKYFGKEKIAEGARPVNSILKAYHTEYYGGRGYANELARRGFTVLVPDVFLWGSRKFPLNIMARTTWRNVDDFDWRDYNAPQESINAYNDTASPHESVVEKYLTVMGTTLAGVINHEDRMSADYLAGRRDVRPGGLGCLGLSGGGLRTVLMQGNCDKIRAAVVVGLMFTYEGLLDHNIRGHTWACFPRMWPMIGDWPDIAACRAPSPLMVQYDTEDQLFTLDCMKAAHARLKKLYGLTGSAKNYAGRFYPGLHKFDLQMQEDAFKWLAGILGH